MPDHVDALIRETLVEQSEVLAVPPEVWGRLQVEMPGRGPAASGDLRTLPRPGFWRRLRLGASLEVAAVLLLILGLVGLGVLRNMPRQTEMAVGPGAALTVEEYPIGERSVDQLTDYEYSERLPQQIYQKRSKWRDVQLGYWVHFVNEKLASTGYKLVPSANDTVDLYHGEELVYPGLKELSRIAISDDGKDFAFVADVWEPTATLITTKGTRPWDLQSHMFHPPALAGNDLVEITVLDSTGTRFAVLKNGQQVYKGDLPPVVADRPVKGIFGWNGQWVVELKGDVIIEGKSLKEQHGYDEVFNWTLIDGKPFYFYRVGAKIGISYDGRHQGVEYDEVMHYMCCASTAHNPMGNDSMVWFHARKGEMWYYVEAGVYK